jgi:hypothetical protein
VLAEITCISSRYAHRRFRLVQPRVGRQSGPPGGRGELPQARDPSDRAGELPCTPPWYPGELIGVVTWLATGQTGLERKRVSEPPTLAPPLAEHR